MTRSLILVFVGLALFLAPACGGGEKQEDGSAPAADGGLRQEGGVTISDNPQSFINNFSTRGWSTDFTRRTVSFDEIFSAGPSKDGIPAIDEPHFVEVKDADRYLSAEEPVIVVALGGEARAYPLQILLWHEIVNDTLGGEPVVVTYCPLCNTALAFERTFKGQILDFGTTGNLRNSDLVMYDRQSESWWQQITGEAIVGTHAGKLLTPLPAAILPYNEFKAAHPGAQVLSRETGHDRAYGTNPYGGYDTGAPFLFEGTIDGRLGATERVVSVVISDESVAYPFLILEKQPVVNDTVGGEPIVIFFKKGTRSALDRESIAQSKDVGAGVAFLRELDGSALTFELKGGRFIDLETGSEWNLSGRAVQGPLSGKQLEPLVHGNHFWFAWAVFRPDTRIFGL